MPCCKPNSVVFTGDAELEFERRYLPVIELDERLLGIEQTKIVHDDFNCDEELWLNNYDRMVHGSQ